MMLPTSPNRIWLLSFWLIVSLLAGLTTGILLWVLVAPLWSGLGVILAAALAVIGLLRPQVIVRPYEVWNRLAGRFADFARLWVVGICFYTIFVAVGRTGAALKLARPGAETKSFWVSRETLAPSAYIYQYKPAARGTTQRRWIFNYLAWAVRSGNPWACCLLPFFILLRAFEIEEEGSFPSNIYTLY